MASNGKNFLFGGSVKCKTRKSKTANESRLETGRLGLRLRSKGKTSAKARKKTGTTVMENPGRYLDIGAKNRIAALSKKLKEAIHTSLEITSYYRTGKRLYL